jgi:uracil-DNA glycosylase family 4
MLVGETPGEREDIEGEPFVGPAGGLLGKALVAAGIEVDDTYLTNAVASRPTRPSSPTSSSSPTRWRRSVVRIPWHRRNSNRARL